MDEKCQISEEVFETILAEAVEDLRKSGLDDEEMFSIIEEQFGLRYARKFFRQG